MANYKLTIEGLTTHFFPLKLLPHQKRYQWRGLFNRQDRKIYEIILRVNKIISYIKHFPPALHTSKTLSSCNIYLRVYRVSLILSYCSKSSNEVCIFLWVYMILWWRGSHVAYIAPGTYYLVWCWDHRYIIFKYYHICMIGTSLMG